MLVQLANAQQIALGNIESKDYEGLQLVILSPQVLAASKNNTDFIRISDHENTAVPFTLYQIANTQSHSFIVFPVVYRTQNDSITVIVIENENKRQLNELLVSVANTTVQKTVSILGSNDNKTWFGLLQDYRLANLSSSVSAEVEKNIVLPLSNYKYLKLTFNNKNSLPINCTRFGIYDSKINYAEQVEITDFKKSISTDNENKTTVIHVLFEFPQLLSWLDFDVQSDMFLRNATIVVNRERRVKQTVETYKQELFRFKLNSKEDLSYSFPEVFVKEFFIEIENRDNPPLDVRSIRLFQKPKYLLANLKQNQSYKISVDTTLGRPNYDIVNFIPKENTLLEVVNIEGFKQIETPKEESKALSFWQSKGFVWTALAIGAMLIAYVAFSFLKDIERKV
ncbi:MAG: DUF3999 family protein [Aestuariibaculum sp.]